MDVEAFAFLLAVACVIGGVFVAFCCALILVSTWGEK